MAGGLPDAGRVWSRDAWGPAGGDRLAFALARGRFPGRILVDAIAHLPLVLPPVVVGWLLLLLLGLHGPIGAWLYAVFGVRLVFTKAGAVLACAVMILPLMLRAIRLSLEAVDPGLEQAARTLGAGGCDRFATVTLPLAAPGVLVGAIIGFAASLGEFGAVITFAANIPGQTQTLPLAIYAALQVPRRRGDGGAAVAGLGRPGGGVPAGGRGPGQAPAHRAGPLTRRPVTATHCGAPLGAGELCACAWGARRGHWLSITSAATPQTIAASATLNTYQEQSPQAPIWAWMKSTTAPIAQPVDHVADRAAGDGADRHRHQPRFRPPQPDRQRGDHDQQRHRGQDDSCPRCRSRSAART